MANINKLTPVHVPNGNSWNSWKLQRNPPTKAELNEFIVQVMKKVINDGSVTLNAEPSKIPSKVFQNADMYSTVKVNGFHVALQIDTQRLIIGLRYDDYKKAGMTDNQVYMAIRVDVEKIIELFDDLHIKS